MPSSTSGTSANPHAAPDRRFGCDVAGVCEAVVVMLARLLLACRAAMRGFVVPLGVQPDFCQRSRVIFRAHRIEKAHPAQFREFAHVRMEHIAPRIARTEFD